MEFDKSRVYTALNADELKVGSKVIIADDIDTLRRRVTADTRRWELVEICDGSCTYRFKAKDVADNENEYMLAYLVSEPEENKLKWTDLNIGDVVVRKDGSAKAMVVHIDLTDHNLHIHLGDGCWYDDEQLAEWEKVE